MIRIFYNNFILNRQILQIVFWKRFQKMLNANSWILVQQIQLSSLTDRIGSGISEANLITDQKIGACRKILKYLRTKLTHLLLVDTGQSSAICIVGQILFNDHFQCFLFKQDLVKNDLTGFKFLLKFPACRESN